MSPATETLPSNATSVLGEARQAYIAIESKNGPHVTPELYTWTGDRLWFATATSTLKARVLDTGSRVAVAVTARGRTVVLDGTVEAIDPRHPGSLRASHAAEVVKTLVSFGLRNGTDLLGFARDALTGATGRKLPDLRMLVAVDPDRVAIIENESVVWSRGWDDPAPVEADAPIGGEAAVAAFPGPAVAPARWFAADNKLFVAPSALAMLGIDGTSPLAVVVDDYNAPGPAAKHGILVRGEGTVDGSGWLQVTASETLEWNGIDIERS